MKTLLTLFVLLFSSSLHSEEVEFFCNAKLHGTDDNGNWVDYNDRISTLKIDLSNNIVTLEWKINDYKFEVYLDIISNIEGKIRALEDSWVDTPGITSISIDINSKVFTYVTAFALTEHEFTTWAGSCN